MKIDKSLTTPLYSQVEAILEERILSGVWEEGYQVPTESELAESFEVSNITIKRAVMNLVDKGMLVRYRGKGTFVTGDQTEKNIHKSEFIKMDKKVSNSHEVLACELHQVQPSVAKKLGLEKNAELVYLERIGFEESDPVSLEYTYIPQEVWPSEKLEIDRDVFVYDFLEQQCGIALKRSKNYFSGAVANDKEVKMLGVRPNTPLFVWERVTYSDAGQPVEYSKFVMKQDKEKYYLELDLS